MLSCVCVHYTIQSSSLYRCHWMAAVVAIPFSRTASSHHHWYGARWFASFSSSHDLYRFIVRQSKDAPRGLWRDLVEIDDIDSDAFIHSTISCLKPYYLTAILFRVSYQTLAIINILASPFQFIQSPHRQHHPANFIGHINLTLCDSLT